MLGEKPKVAKGGDSLAPAPIPACNDSDMEAFKLVESGGQVPMLDADFLEPERGGDGSCVRRFNLAGSVLQSPVGLSAGFSRHYETRWCNHSRRTLEGLSTYAPLVLVDGYIRSTVTLLSRFMYNWRARTLDSRKRYQLRTGFIFETVLK